MSGLRDSTKCRSREQRKIGPRTQISSRPRGFSLYDAPAWYDLLHEEGSADEAGLIADLHKLWGNGGKAFLEPACGTGRLLARLTTRGFRLTGYDLSRKAATFARKRCPAAEVVVADMTSFIRPEAFDLAFNLVGTFRHLMSDQAALKHLRKTAASLRRGGIYIVQLDLADYTHAHDDEETWTARARGRRIDHAMLCLAPDRKKRREHIINFLTLREKGRQRLLKSEYDLRSYDLPQWKALIARSPFRIAQALIHPPKGPGVRDAVFVLRKGPRGQKRMRDQN